MKNSLLCGLGLLSLSLAALVLTPPQQTRCGLARRRSSHMERRDAGSIPEDGSSRSTAREPPMSAQPTLSLRFIPPESACDRVCVGGGGRT